MTSEATKLTHQMCQYDPGFDQSISGCWVCQHRKKAGQHANAVHCKDCHRTWTGLEAQHCVTCHLTFSSSWAADLHRQEKFFNNSENWYYVRPGVLTYDDGRRARLAEPGDTDE